MASVKNYAHYIFMAEAFIQSERSRKQPTHERFKGADISCKKKALTNLPETRAR